MDRRFQIGCDIGGTFTDIAVIDSSGRRFADKADTMTAARMCLRAARILNMEMPDDPAYEQMLRRALSNDAQNESANYLFEAMLAIEMAASARDVAMTMHAHPTLSETVMEAAESLYGLAVHQMPSKKS